jgi:hypothetical protein
MLYVKVKSEAYIYDNIRCCTYEKTDLAVRAVTH